MSTGPNRKSGRPNRPTDASRRASSERAAAARERILADQRRRRIRVVIAAVSAVVVVVAVLIVVRAVSGGKGPKSGTKASTAAGSVVSEVTGVPSSVLDTVGKGASVVAFKGVSESPLTSNGKPEVLYIGAEWCPYCAATRWSLAVALSRFGTLTGLGQVRSSPTDVYPNTPTLTFHGASYTSPYLTFVGKEIQSNQVSGGKYENLDTMTAAESRLFTAAGSTFPFLDVAGRYQLTGAAFDPQVLAGKTQEQVAAALKDPSSSIAKAVDGGANAITAQLCKVTGGKPGSVCAASGVTAASGS